MSPLGPAQDKVFAPTAGEPNSTVGCRGRNDVEVSPQPALRPRLPQWLKAPAPGNPRYLELKQVMRGARLHTVCEEAHCPNIGECWGAGSATFMILGDICTRRCHYCAVTTGRPTGIDIQEPGRLAETVRLMGLDYCVITSVNRDDLADGGAFIFASCIRKIREQASGLQGGSLDS